MSEETKKKWCYHHDVSEPCVACHQARVERKLDLVIRLLRGLKENFSVKKEVPDDSSH